jgi:outer membrane biosynthesis protein TonB
MTNKWLVAAFLAVSVSPNLATRPSRSATVQSRSPILTASELPLYPPAAIAARVSGTVALSLTTDGRKVSRIEIIQGPPMLVQAARQNVQTWEFEAHEPTSVTTAFNYVIEYDGTCDRRNSTVRAELPRYAVITQHSAISCPDAQSVAPTR